MYKYFTVTLCVCIYCLVFQNIAHGQCYKNVKPTTESEKMMYRMRGNRCEGFYESKISSGSLKIVSVTIGAFRFKNDSKEELYLSPILKDRMVRIRALAIPLNTYYRMDAEIEPKSSLRWPVGDVLYHSKLTDKQIGVYGFIFDNDQIQYVPLKVSSTFSYKHDRKDRDIYICLRPYEDVKNVQWCISKKSKDNFCSSKWTKLKKKIYYEGKRILCKVSSSTVKGPFCLRIKAKSIKNNERLSFEANISY